MYELSLFSRNSTLTAYALKLCAVELLARSRLSNERKGVDACQHGNRRVAAAAGAAPPSIEAVRVLGRLVAPPVE